TDRAASPKATATGNETAEKLTVGGRLETFGNSGVRPMCWAAPAMALAGRRNLAGRTKRRRAAGLGHRERHRDHGTATRWGADARTQRIADAGHGRLVLLHNDVRHAACGRQALWGDRHDRGWERAASGLSVVWRPDGPTDRPAGCQCRTTVLGMHRVPERLRGHT